MEVIEDDVIIDPVWIIVIIPHCETYHGMSDHGMIELRVTSKRRQRKWYCKDSELNKEGVNKDQR